MEHHEITIKFKNPDEREAGVYAKELQEYLKDEINGLQIDLRKDNPDTQDFGATLVLVLGTPVLIALANGIADYFRKRPNSQLDIECGPGKKVSFKGSSDDAAKISESLKEMCQ